MAWNGVLNARHFLWAVILEKVVGAPVAVSKGLTERGVRKVIGQDGWRPDRRRCPPKLLPGRRAVVSTITLEKVGGLRRAGARGDRQTLLDQRRRPSSPVRWRQRTGEERSKVSLCRKNSSPQKTW